MVRQTGGTRGRGPRALGSAQSEATRLLSGHTHARWNCRGMWGLFSGNTTGRITALNPVPFSSLRLDDRQGYNARRFSEFELIQVLEYSPPPRSPKLPWPAVVGLWAGYAIGSVGAVITDAVFYHPNPEGLALLPVVLPGLVVLSLVPTFLFGLVLWIYIRFAGRLMRGHSTLSAVVVGAVISFAFAILFNTFPDPPIDDLAVVLAVIAPPLVAVLFTSRR